MTNNAGYAPVNGLAMYYEIHGGGAPLVVLPGAYMTVELMGDLVPALAKSRQVIGVEFQGHGQTGDIERPFSYEQFADDTAALLGHLGIDQADVYGYSLGGGSALQLGLRHPGRVRKLVIASASYNSDGLYPEVGGIENITPELFDGTPWRNACDLAAPDPSAFPTLVWKLKQLDMTPFDWPIDELAASEEPALAGTLVLSAKTMRERASPVPASSPASGRPRVWRIHPESLPASRRGRIGKDDARGGGSSCTAISDWTPLGAVTTDAGAVGDPSEFGHPPSSPKRSRWSERGWCSWGGGYFATSTPVALRQPGCRWVLGPVSTSIVDTVASHARKMASTAARSSR